MDIFHHRDPADYSHDAYYPPPYFAPSHSPFNTSRSYPATSQPCLNLFLRSAHSAPSLGYVRDTKDNIPAEKEPCAVMKESKLTHSHPSDITLPEDTTLVQEEQHTAMKEFNHRMIKLASMSKLSTTCI